MKWINHIAIAGATTAVIAPHLVPIAILGSTAPDWLEWVYKGLTGNNIRHRGVTHYVSSWVIGLMICLFGFDFNHFGAAFFYGGLTHVIADSFTVMGVPLSPLSDTRFHLFGGRLRTGESGEFLIAWGVVLACFFVGSYFNAFHGWYPFFYDWAGFYDAGLIDASEWKANRFRFI